MIDIHCHILPGLDDGAFHDAEALQMAAQASAAMTRCMVCTPHDPPKGVYPLRRLLEVFHHLCSLLRSEGIPLRLFLGQEILLSRDYLKVIDKLKRGYLLTINRSVYPLVEFPPTEGVASMCKKLDALCAEGFSPIVAHPERYRHIQDSPEEVRRLKKHGAFLQLNKGSLEGTFGEAAEATALYILDARLADVFASDAHSPYVRTTPLRDVHEWLGERYSTDYANLLLRQNPKSILKNAPLDRSDK